MAGKRLEGLALDLRFALRSLGRTPWVLGGGILSMAVVIGANTAIFSFVSAVFLRPLPVADPDELVRPFTLEESTSDLYGLSYPNFVSYRESGGEVFEDIAVFRAAPLRAVIDDSAEMIMGEIVSRNFFELLGISAGRGRTFDAGGEWRPGGYPEVVLGHGFWRRRFGADPGVVGRTIQLNGRPFTVIGVSREDFRGLDLLRSPDLWVPLDMHQTIFTGRLAEWFPFRDAVILNGVARLQDGLGLAAAATGAEAVAERLEQAYPEANKGLSLTILPLAQARLQPSLRSKVLVASVGLSAVVVLLFVVACANVANLLLARALRRREEMATRIALGAGRGRLLRQLLVEGLVVGVGGGVLGFALALAGRRLLWALRPAFVPDSLEIPLDWRVAVFGLALTLACALVFGLVPALQSLNPGVAGVLRGQGAGGGSSGRSLLPVRDLLVVVQVALTSVALVGAGMFLVELRRALAVDPGFNPEDLAVVSFDVEAAGYDEPRGAALQDELLDRIRAIPMVRSASLGERAPLEPRYVTRVGVWPEGTPPGPDERPPMASLNTVAPGFLETLQLPLVRGDGIAPALTADGPRVAVVNQALARRLWPEREAVGQRFLAEGEDEPYLVVGVSEDFEYVAAGEAPREYFFRALEQNYSPEFSLVVRTEGNPELVFSEIRHALRAIDRELAPGAQWTMSSLRAEALWGPRTATALLGCFALVALLLAGTGIHSLLAFSINSRLREIGLRQALGAGRRQLLGWTFGRGAIPVVVGLALGLVVGMGLGPRAADLFGELGPEDLLVALLAVLVLAAVAGCAILVPARRALRVDAAKVLRTE